MKNCIYVLLFLSLLISCSNKSNNKITTNSFKKTINLEKGEPIFTKEYTAKNFWLADSLLIIQTNQDSSLFKVFSTTDLKFINTFGTKGEGPKDFLYPYTSNQVIKDSLGIKLWVNDLFKYKLSLINITESIKKGNTVIDTSFKINPKYDFTHDLIHFNDETFFGNHGPNAIERFRITKYNIQKDQKTHANLLPEIENTDLLRRSAMYSLYFDYLAIKPDKTKLVSAMLRFNRIDFYDIDLNIINEVIDKDEHEVTDVQDILHKNGKQLMDLKMYYSSIFTTNNYVYGLHRKGQPAVENGEKNIDIDIRVFDWNGNPEYLLKVPNDLTNFVVDEKNGWIYGIDSYNEKIYRYKINLTT